MFNKASIKRHCILFITLVLFTGLAFFDSWAYTDEECQTCHAAGSLKSNLTISLETYRASIHGRNGILCADCHSDILGDDHESNEGITRIGCYQCHDEVNRHGGKRGSIHRPKCYDCHGTHDILEKERPDSSIHEGQLLNTCRKCHAAECESDRCLFLLPSFRMATHVKQNFSENYSKERCLGCHQTDAAHGEGGIIHEDDCYRCHRSDGKHGKLLGRFHKRMEMKDQPAFFLAGLLNEVIILAVLFFGLLFIVQWIVLKRNGSE